MGMGYMERFSGDPLSNRRMFHLPATSSEGGIPDNTTKTEETMHIALLGNGKTGSQVASLVNDEFNLSCSIFTSTHPATLAELRNCDIVVSFLPGEAFVSYIPLLIESRLPVICGSTGFEFPNGIDNFSRVLQEADLSWIYARNFSLGMHLIHEILPILGLAEALLPEVRFAIHDVHHAEKRDAPSGTALSWQEWLGTDATITSERVGDTVGDHELRMVSPNETITLHHSAQNRRIFAQGALKAADWILGEETTPGPGLHSFSKVIRQQFSTQRNHVS